MQVSVARKITRSMKECQKKKLEYRAQERHSDGATSVYLQRL